jgi:hypothetical protein
MRTGTGLARGATLAALLTCAIGGPLPGAAAAEVQTIGFDGQSAAAMFDSFDGCASRMALVMPVEGRTRDNSTGATSDATLLIQLVEFDFCKLSQSIRFGQVEMARRDFRVRGDLGSATLRTTVQLNDWMTGEPAPVELDLTWRAAGAGMSDRQRSHTRSADGSMEIYRGVGRIRPAVASGTISDGASDYTAGGDSLSGQVKIVR